PDGLLAQILMASTYPLEIVKANRWFLEPRHAALSGDQLAAALEGETWDPSIKALAIFPQILRMMGANLDWTEQLGDSFVAQQATGRASSAGAAEGVAPTPGEGSPRKGKVRASEPVNPASMYPPV